MKRNARPLPRLILFVVSSLSPALTAAQAIAADPPGAVTAGTRKPGSYVLFLGKDGRAIAGSYMISKQAFMQTTDGRLVLVDRPYFPRVWMFVDDRGVDRSTYSPAVDPALWRRKKEHAYKRIVSRFDPKKAKAPFDPVGKIESIVLVRKVGTVEIAGHVYPGITYSTKRSGYLPKGGTRVYLPGLAMDVPLLIAARTKRVVTGRALAATDFENLYAFPVKRDDPFSKCFTAVRSSKKYRQAATRTAQTVDRYNAENFLRTGIPFYWARRPLAQQDVVYKAGDCATAIDKTKRAAILAFFGIEP